MAESNQHAAVAAEDAVAARAEPAAVPLEEKLRVVEEELRAEPISQASASLAEESGAGLGLDSAETALLRDEAQDETQEELANRKEVYREELKATESIAGPFPGVFQTFAAETLDYSRRCLESRAALVTALLGAKTIENAVQIQASYAKSASARLVVHLMRMSALSWRVAKEAAKPIVK
jgi:hypothetical protein